MNQSFEQSSKQKYSNSLVFLILESRSLKLVPGAKLGAKKLMNLVWPDPKATS